MSERLSELISCINRRVKSERETEETKQQQELERRRKLREEELDEKNYYNGKILAVFKKLEYGDYCFQLNYGGYYPNDIHFRIMRGREYVMVKVKNDVGVEYEMSLHEQSLVIIRLVYDNIENIIEQIAREYGCGS